MKTAEKKPKVLTDDVQYMLGAVNAVSRNLRKLGYHATSFNLNQFPPVIHLEIPHEYSLTGLFGFAKNCIITAKDKRYLRGIIRGGEVEIHWRRPNLKEDAQ